MELEIKTTQKDKTFDSLLTLTSDIFKVSKESIMKKSKVEGIIRARSMFLHFAKFKFNFSYTELGWRTQRNHTTILHSATKSHDSFMSADSAYRQAFFEMRAATEKWISGSNREIAKGLESEVISNMEIQLKRVKVEIDKLQQMIDEFKSQGIESFEMELEYDKNKV